MQHFGSLLNVFWGKFSHPLKSCPVQLTFGEDFLKHPPVLVLWIPVFVMLSVLGQWKGRKEPTGKTSQFDQFLEKETKP